ncbi:MAG: Fic family protein [Saprospiraceae bacterium]|nr:Fic family protein [Saprospiraceae bacterium]
MNYHKDLPYNALPDLPPNVNLETPEIFRLTIQANKLLAELKGYCHTLPNPNLLLNTIVLQESKESSAIENIVTTQDELYKATLNIEGIKNSAAKEVIQYREAMYWGLGQMQKTGLITTNLLVGIMQKLRATNDDIRKNTGTKLANPITGSVVYTPPEGETNLREKMAALEKFINDDDLNNLDPLIKMALIHYQFEAIHPFSDGNGRTGRILNVLYLINKGLIGLPVLYLSYYIIQNKSDYYRLLREVTEKQSWVEWVGFIVKGVGETAELALQKITAILQLKADSDALLKQTLKSSYTRELTDLLYSYPYIKIKILVEYGIAKRQTAGDYLKKIEAAGLLTSLKIGKETYFINHQLMNILSK